MKTIEDINSDILQEWKASDPERFTDANFTSDGLVCSNELWENAPLRILYITKDQNAKGEEDGAWHLSDEVVNLKALSYRFFQNMLYTLYGLGHTTVAYKQTYDFTNVQAVEFYNNTALARINVKKKAGSVSISYSELYNYIKKDAEFIKRQIINLDADIIVCCGYSQNIERSGNMILNFITDNCYANLKKSPDDNWIYYDEISNKIAINSWHPSYYGVGLETFYSGMIDAYHNFLQNHPDFTNSHRK